MLVCACVCMVCVDDVYDIVCVACVCIHIYMLCVLKYAFLFCQVLNYPSHFTL